MERVDNGMQTSSLPELNRILSDPISQLINPMHLPKESQINKHSNPIAFDYVCHLCI